MAACTVEDCTTVAYARGYCIKHYRRVQRHGNAQSVKRQSHCSIPGCREPHRAQGLCGKHNNQRARAARVIEKIT